MVFFVQHILSINHYGPILSFSNWTNTKYTLLWSDFHFSLFGPIRSSFFFGPMISFLRLDQYEIHSFLVHLSLFFIWTNSNYILLWSIYLFSLFGPIRITFTFGPFIFFLYLDQFELHSPLVQLSLFFVWTNSNYILLWSNFLFSLFGPIRNTLFFGPIFNSLYLDQFPLPQHKKAPRGRRLFIGSLIV